MKSPLPYAMAGVLLMAWMHFTVMASSFRHRRNILPRMEIYEYMYPVYPVYRVYPAYNYLAGRIRPYENEERNMYENVKYNSKVYEENFNDNSDVYNYFSDGRRGFPYAYGETNIFADDVGMKFNEDTVKDNLKANEKNAKANLKVKKENIKSNLKVKKENVKDNSNELWRPDGKCGPRHPLPAPLGGPSQCNPRGKKPCCNPSSGFCGKTPGHCACAGCTDYRNKKNSIKTPNGVMMPPPGIMMPPAGVPPGVLMLDPRLEKLEKEAMKSEKRDHVSKVTPDIMNEIIESSDKKKIEVPLIPAIVPDIHKELIVEATAAHEAQNLFKRKMSSMYNLLITTFKTISKTYNKLIETL